MEKETFARRALVVAAAMFAVPAFAQGDEPAPGAEVAPPAASVPADAADAAEVIVSARKRGESILKVPVVATALGADDLEKFATADISAVTDRVTGILLGSGTGSFGAQISLRGVGTSTMNAAIDQSVSLNVDGMQLTQGMAYRVGMFDAAQIEVLKGPQALFFGKSSPGGVISLSSADPGSEFELITRAGYEFEAEERRGEVIISGPVTDDLGLRLAAAYSQSEGYFKNLATGDEAMGGLQPRYRDLAPEREILVRGTAKWQATDALRLRLKLNYAEDDILGDAGGLQYVSCPDGISAPAGVPFLGGGEDCKLDRNIRIVDMSPDAYPGIRNKGTPFSKLRQWFGTLDGAYQLSDIWQLSSVTGAYKVQHDVLFNGTATTFAGPPLAADLNFRRQDFTQELRLTSDDKTRPLNVMLGAFYQRGEMYNTNNLIGNTDIGLPPVLTRGYHDVDIESISAFGQLLWQVVPTLELAAGVRWTREDREHRATSTVTGTAERVPTARPKLSTDDLSPELSATWTPTDDLTVFASYKQAQKSGSFNTVSLPMPGQDLSFGDEKVDGFEAGIKSRWLDRRLSANLAAYRYEYDDMQVGANETAPDGSIAIRTLNAASATVYGVDADLSYRPRLLSGLTLRAAANYNHARYDRFSNAPCWGGQLIAEGCDRLFDAGTGAFTAQDLSGRPLMRAPDWSTNVGFSYETDLPKGMLLAVASDTQYTSAYYTNILLRRDMEQGGYFKTSLSLTLSRPEHGWEVALIGNNLNDKIVSGNCTNGNLSNGILFGGFATGTDARGPAGVDELACNVERGREVWLRLTLRPLAS